MDDLTITSTSSENAKVTSGAVIDVDPQRRTMASYAVTESDLDSVEASYTQQNRAHSLASLFVGAGVSATLSYALTYGKGAFWLGAVLIVLCFGVALAFYLFGRSSANSRATLLERMRKKQEVATHD